MQRSVCSTPYCMNIISTVDSFDLPEPTWTQARTQLGTPRGAKSFLRGAQIFNTMSNTFELCPKHFSMMGANIFLFQGGAKIPLPGYGPAWTQTSDEEYNDLTASNRRPSTSYSSNTSQSFSLETWSCALSRLTKQA